MDLQPRWEINPISNLKWSGSESTKNLTRLMMDLCNTKTMATVSHAQGTIESLIRSLKENLESYPQNLVVFHTDQNDYQLDED